MLLGTRRGISDSDAESTYGSVHNYYEAKVFEAIQKKSDRAKSDGNFMADVACVALNRLPPKYVRYDVDLTFFLSPDELIEMNDRVDQAVEEALTYVESRANKPPLGQKAN